MKPGKPRREAATRRHSDRRAEGTSRGHLPPGRDVAETRSIAIQADCTHRHAAALRTLLLSRLDAPEQVNLDIGAVERVDTACLQLLTAFVRERGQKGRSVAWQGDSGPLRQAASMLGLSVILGLDSTR